MKVTRRQIETMHRMRENYGPTSWHVLGCSDSIIRALIEKGFVAPSVPHGIVRRDGTGDPEPKNTSRAAQYILTDAGQKFCEENPL